jgi:hypothetical protein
MPKVKFERVSSAAREAYKALGDPKSPAQVRQFKSQYGTETYDRLTAEISDQKQDFIDTSYAIAAVKNTKGRTFLPKKIQDRNELYDEIIDGELNPFEYATAKGVYIDRRYPRLDNYSVLQHNADHIVMNNNQLGGDAAIYRIDPTGAIRKSDGTLLSDPLLQNLVALPRHMYSTVTRLGAPLRIAPPPRSRPNFPEIPGSQVVTPSDNPDAIIYGWNYRSRLEGAYAIQSDNEYVTYIRHLKYTTEFSNTGIESSVNLQGRPTLVAGAAKVRGYETLRKVLLHCASDPALQGIWHRYRTYSFIRNVIDFLHDYVHEGVKLVGALLALRSLIAGFDEALLASWLPHIQSSITAGGKVNQTICKKLSKMLATEFKREMKANPAISAWLSWLVVEKDNALVTTANKSNLADIGTMLDQAYRNGCRGLYIESLATSATRLFSQIPNLAEGGGGPAMAYIDVLSGHWDAGSGISYVEAAKAKPGLAQLTLARSPSPAGMIQIPRTVNAGGANAPATVIGDSAVGGFGLFPVRIDESGAGMIETVAPGGLTMQINGRQRLSVNGLLASVGLPGVRGSGEAGAVVAFTLPAGLDLTSTDPSTKLAALCLKQWTDTIQTDDLVNAERYDISGNSLGHILAAYSDYDAEEYCAMIGGTSIMQRGRDFFYYCYDMTKRKVPAAELVRKRKTMIWAQTNSAGVQRYVECWHRNAISSLNFIVQDTEDPAVFFAAVAALNRLYESYAGIAGNIATHITRKNPDDTTMVSLFPSTGEELMSVLTQNMSIVATFDEMYANLTRVFSGITTIRAARLEPSVFIAQFEAIQQQIINALPRMPDDSLYNNITALFFAYGFLLPFDEVAYPTDALAAAGLANKERTIDNIIVSLRSTIGATGDATIKDKLAAVERKLIELRWADLAKIRFIHQLVPQTIQDFVPSFDPRIIGCGPTEFIPAAVFPQLARGGRRRTIRNRRPRHRSRKH